MGAPVSLGAMVSMVIILLRLSLLPRLYFDDRMHPGMNTALEKVNAFTQACYLCVVTGMYNRIGIAFWTAKLRQSYREVEVFKPSTPKLPNLGKGMIFTAV